MFFLDEKLTLFDKKPLEPFDCEGREREKEREKKGGKRGKRERRVREGIVFLLNDENDI